MHLSSFNFAYFGPVMFNFVFDPNLIPLFIHLLLNFLLIEYVVLIIC